MKRIHPLMILSYIYVAASLCAPSFGPRRQYPDSRIGFATNCTHRRRRVPTVVVTVSWRQKIRCVAPSGLAPTCAPAGKAGAAGTAGTHIAEKQNSMHNMAWRQERGIVLWSMLLGHKVENNQASKQFEKVGHDLYPPLLVLPPPPRRAPSRLSPFRDLPLDESVGHRILLVFLGLRSCNSLFMIRPLSESRSAIFPYVVTFEHPSVYSTITSTRTSVNQARVERNFKGWTNE